MVCMSRISTITTANGTARATQRLIVIADADPEEIVKEIKEKFGKGVKRPRPTPQDLHVKTYDKSFAIVATDPEIRSEEVQIIAHQPPEPPVTTVEQYRDDIGAAAGGAGAESAAGRQDLARGYAVAERPRLCRQ